MKVFLFLIGLFSFSSRAQFSVSGKVFSDAGGAALSGASVYLNNSTIGTTTSADGSFMLSGIRPGNYEIIVSYVSFDVLVHTVNISDKNLRFEFRLSPKAQQMRNILVMSDERRKKMMALFKSQFLGITDAGEKCRIENESEIMFEPGKGKTDIYAFADHPLVVINRELGYKISFDLQEFYLDESGGRTFFYGYSKYEELEKGNRDKIKKKRKGYYFGSTMHFFQSMYIGNAEENNFRIFRKFNVSSNGVVTKQRQQVFSKNLIYVDSISQRKYLEWDNQITVQYLRNPVYKNALFTKTMVIGSLPIGIESDLTMLEKPVYFTEQGLPENPMKIAFSGFWSYEKLGNMLPIDYRPED